MGSDRVRRDISSWKLCIEIQHANESECKHKPGSEQYTCHPVTKRGRLSPIPVATRGEHRALAWLEHEKFSSERFVLRGEDFWVL